MSGSLSMDMKTWPWAVAAVAFVEAPATYARQAVQWHFDEDGSGRQYQLRARLPGHDWHAWRVFGPAATEERKP